MMASTKVREVQAMYVLPAGILPAALFAIADVNSPMALPQQPLELSSGECSSVLIVMKGSGRLEHSGFSTLLEAGMTAEFGPDARFRLTCTDDVELRLCHIHYHTLLMPGRAEPAVHGHPVRVRISTGAEPLQALARELLSLKLRGQLYEPLGGTRVLYELLHQLVDCHRRADEAMQADAAQRIRAYLERHYTSRVDKDRLAAVAGRSRKALGLKPQERVLSDIINGEAINAGTAISMEELPSFAGDHIILTTFDGDELAAELKQSGLWQGLDAVKNGNVHEVDFDLLYNEDPVAMEHQLDFLTELLANPTDAETAP